MLAADKKPGVCPLACVEIWMRLWADCLNTETKVEATTACGNINLCASLWAGIEGNLYAVCAVWLQSAGWEYGSGEVTAPQLATKGTLIAGILTTDPGNFADATHLRYMPDTGFWTALFDAKNGFNEMNQYLMLWTTAYCWTKASWFASKPLLPSKHSLCPQPAWKTPHSDYIQGGPCPGMQPLHDPLWSCTLASSQEDASGSP
jgi:hypothetical protein